MFVWSRSGPHQIKMSLADGILMSMAEADGNRGFSWSLTLNGCSSSNDNARSVISPSRQWVVESFLGPTQ